MVFLGVVRGFGVEGFRGFIGGAEFQVQGYSRLRGLRFPKEIFRSGILYSLNPKLYTLRFHKEM